MPSLLRFSGRIARGLSACALAAAALAFAPHANAKDPPTVQWSEDWPRFRTSEGFLTAGLALQAGAALFLYPDPERNWNGGILFDDAVRGALRLESRSARDRASQVSDYIYYAMMAYPTLVDVVIVADEGHHAPDVAGQMLAMNLEAYAFAGAVSLTGQKLGRARPAARECGKDPNYSDKCDNDTELNASFLSGHTTLAFTSAGLMCAHHQHLPLYGGGMPDLFACLASLSAASTAGALRVASDNHYTSDVLLGMGVGLFAGYGLPSLLHYGFGSGKRASASVLPTFRTSPEAGGINAVLAPALDPTGAGVMLVGTF